jgi:hypothetical protein
VATLQADYTHDLAGLVTLASDDLEVLFNQFDAVDADLVRDALAETLPGLSELYGSAAATLAANWYDDQRGAQGIRGAFQAIPAELPGPARLEALAGWAVSPLYQATPDRATTLVKLSGGLQRIIANAGRDTITSSSVADPGAKGWKRIGVGRDCEFCRMLISRGSVYTEASVKFVAHDHCNCGAAPAFRAG